MRRVWMLAMLAGCGQRSTSSHLTPFDAADDASSVSDAVGDAVNDAMGADASVDGGVCAPYCNGGLYECGGPTGHTYKQCIAGCVASPSAHCGVIVPTGVVTTADLATDPQLGALVISAGGATVNTDTGEISGVRAAGTGIISGIDFTVRSGVGVFRAASITANGNVLFQGVNAVAWVATTRIDVFAMLDVTGGCVGRTAGPGGGNGALAGASATGPGAGAGGITSQGGYSGGAGGTHAVNGGVGGTSFPTGAGGPEIAGGAIGAPFGDAEITVLRGGGGGGGGAGPGGGAGGGGGGAIQLVAGTRVDFDGTSSFAGIEASGCGGKHGAAAISSATPGGGGGGGAGGAILIEAPYIDTGFSGTQFRVIGGGGGAYDVTGSPTADGNGDYWSRGGIPGGGTGGTRLFNGRTIVGEQGGGSQSGGGGGGSVGRIRFNTITGGLFVPNGGNTVPNLEDAVTTTTQGTAPAI